MAQRGGEAAHEGLVKSLREDYAIRQAADGSQQIRHLAEQSASEHSPTLSTASALGWLGSHSPVTSSVLSSQP